MLDKTIATAALAAGIVVAPLAHADGNPDNLEQLIGQLYTQVQRGCTPQTAPSFQGVAWDDGRPHQTGPGRIIDANPSLGGPFQYGWNLGPSVQPGWRAIKDPGGKGYWDVDFEFC